MPCDPPLYAFLDFRNFLRAWLDLRAGKPSVRGLARKLECSPSMLSSVLNGSRDLSASVAERLVELLALDEAERDYFKLLVEVEQAPIRARKRAARDEAMAMRRYHLAPRVEDAAYLLFSRWYYPAVLELTRCVGFRPDPLWIAATLQPTVSPEEAADALSTLSSAGLLTVGPDGVMRASEEVFVTDHEATRVVSRALAPFHRLMLERAAGTLTEVTRDRRHLTTVTLALSEPLLAEIKGLMSRLNEEVIGRSTQDPEATGARDRVYQLSMQLIPLTQTTT